MPILSWKGGLVEEKLQRYKVHRPSQSDAPARKEMAAKKQKNKSRRDFYECESGNTYPSQQGNRIWCRHLGPRTRALRCVKKRWRLADKCLAQHNWMELGVLCEYQRYVP